jgi:hypothetical protein
MADEKTGLAAGAFPASSSPVIHLAQIKDIQTYQVQEMELEQLDSIVATESRKLAFATFSAGILVSAVLSWCAADSSKMTTMAIGFHWAVMISAGLFMLSSGWDWLSARRSRPRLLRTIRERSGQPLQVVK